MSEFLKEGFIVSIPTLKGRSEFWQITAKEPFTYETANSTSSEFSVVANGADSDFKNITVLEPDDNPPRLYQVRIGFKDGADYYLKIPTGTNRFGLDEDKDVGYLNSKNCHYTAMNEMFEFWLVHDYYPSINASNDSGVQLTPKAYFSGMKYDIEPVTDQAAIAKAKTEKRYKLITVGGTKL